MTDPISLYDLVRPMRVDVNTNATQTAAAATTAATQQMTNTGKSNSGNYGIDTFSRVGSTIGTGWTATNTGLGSVATNGVDAYWNPSGSAAATEFDRYTAATTQTDYQLITVVLDYPTIKQGALRQVIGRCDSTNSNYVALQWDGSSMSVWKVVSGTATQIGTSVPYIPQVSDQVQFTVGTATNAREFIGSVNGNPIIDRTDTAATLSIVGSSNRYTGLYWSTDGTNLPGNLHSFHIADNTTPTTVGSGALITRTNTSGVGSSSGSALLAAGFYGNTSFASSDITVDLSTNKFTVVKAGLYLVTYRIKLASTGSLAGGQLSMLLYKNGAIYQWGPSWAMDTSATMGPAAVWGQFVVQLNATDYVQPGLNCSAAFSSIFVGEATGAQSFFAVTAASRSGF